MPKCKINGKEVEVAQGATIIQAFKAAGMDIAHYCWHPALSVAGVCRLCMVQIEGMPRLQIACNTEVKEGMVINNNSQAVKDAVKWGLDFHLINHPLDCPICDQAGECGLQEQYMAFGKYDPEMSEPKVKKHKVVDLGPTVVLDSERCILCSRCVRFTEEVTKTSELGIFNRGDRSEIGTFEGKPLANKYSLNTVDICPVGALTSKDFRFRQRVWYLKEHKTICTGCSTGCSVAVYHNEEGAWRVKPRLNPEVNGHWMCDEGRDVYKFLNAKSRLLNPTRSDRGVSKTFKSSECSSDLQRDLKEWLGQPDQVAVLVTGQYSVEEYEALFQLLTKEKSIRQIYHWRNNPETFESFDGLLIRGDKNSNTKGLLTSMEKFGLDKTWDDFVQKLSKGQISTLLVVGPENQASFPKLDAELEQFLKVARMIWMAPGTHPKLAASAGPLWQLPVKTFFEKEGTFVNHQGKSQKVTAGPALVTEALSLSEWARMMSSGYQPHDDEFKVVRHVKENFFTTSRGNL